MEQRVTEQRELRLLREAKSLKYDLMLKMRESGFTYRRFFDEFKDSAGEITQAQLGHVIYTTFHLLSEHDERQRNDIVEKLMNLFRRPRSEVQERQMLFQSTPSALPGLSQGAPSDVQ